MNPGTRALCAALGLPALGLAACATDPADDDSAADDDTVTGDDDSAGDDDAADDDVALPQSQAVVSTTDYAVGSLALIGIEDWAIQDEVVPTSGDPSVQVVDGFIAIVNGFGTDNVTVYTRSDWSAPRFQISTGSGSNPRQIDSCGGSWWITLYEESSVLIVNPANGVTTGTLDLGDWEDSDGLPEAHSVIEVGGMLYISLQRFVREGYVWNPAEDGGRILEVDCGLREVVREWSTGPSPTLQRHPLDDSKLLLFEGVHYDASYQIALDGGVRVFDPAQSAIDSTWVFDDATLGGNLVGLAVGEDGKGLLAVEKAAGFDLVCADFNTGATNVVSTTTSFVTDMGANDRGEVWVVNRAAPWIDPESDAGIQVFDGATCVERTTGAWLMTSLEPYSLDFL